MLQSTLILVGFLSIQLAWSSLTLPSTDPNPILRQKKVAFVASQIENEPRKTTIDGVDYHLNKGPVPNGTNMAATIIAKELGLLQSHGNRNVRKVFGIASSLPIHNLSDFDTLYDKLSTTITRPISTINFNDESFAQDRLTLKGFRMQALKKLSNKNLGLSDYQVSKICGWKLRQALTKGKVFIIDLSHVSKFNDPKSPHKYVPGVKGYFCVNNKDAFLPLAINVNGGLKFSSFDTKKEWTLAKMILNAAEFNDTQMLHFLETHLILEPIRVELMRSMSENHPVYAILNHHFLQLFGNFQAGLVTLLSKNTGYDQTFAYGATGSLRALKNLLETFRFQSTVFETRMARDGLNNVPNFKYRDDSRIHIWAIRGFLKKFLKVYYKNSRMVRKDKELQKWAQRCSTMKQLSDFPKRFKNLSSLIATLAHLIFLTSVKHHAMNSDVAWHVLGFPFSTPALWAPLPKQKGEKIDLLSFAPPKQARAPLLALGAGFLRPLPRNLSLVASYNSSFLGTAASAAIESHQLLMKCFDILIQLREWGADRPYQFLSPRKLAHYVWI